MPSAMRCVRPAQLAGPLRIEWTVLLAGGQPISHLHGRAHVRWVHVTIAKAVLLDPPRAAASTLRMCPAYGNLLSVRILQGWMHAQL
jgi:hypothetical protein